MELFGNKAALLILMIFVGVLVGFLFNDFTLSLSLAVKSVCITVFVFAVISAIGYYTSPKQIAHK